MQNITALIITAILFLAGLVGTVLPVLPGSPLIWAGMLIYGLFNKFESFGPGFLAIQALLALLVITIDYIFAALGSRYFGGSKKTLFGAAVGLFVGLFFFPLGLLVGPFVGAALADFFVKRSTKEAVKSGLGASLGFLGALPLKLILEIAMITWFIIRIF